MMDLPESVSTAIAEGGRPELRPELFHDRDVFAAEFARIFLRPWLAPDHVSRLPEDGRYFLAEAGPRSILVTREGDGAFHALRNNCIHAGYPVCEEEEGEEEGLLCPYHGWRYAIDGRLVEPRLHAEQESSPKYRLASYPVHAAGGLIFIDPSGAGEGLPPAAELPAWLGGGTVTGRRRFETQLNWKHLRQHLWSAPELVSPFAIERVVELGPLCRLLANAEETVLLQVIPRSPERSDCRAVRIAAEPDAAEDSRTDERIAAALAQLVASPPAALDREFFLWYAELMG